MPFKNQNLSKTLSKLIMGEVKELYKNEFDGVYYANAYLSDVEYELQWLPEEFYHHLFTTGKLTGQTMLDIGCGPAVREAISASAYIPEIYLGDISEKNLNEVKKWLKNEQGCLDYTIQFKHVAKLEYKSDIQYLEDRVRVAVKDVIPCDILAENPFYPEPFKQFDIVISSNCLECYNDDDIYFKGLSNMTNLIRPGGHLVLVGVLGNTEYRVGEKMFPVHCLYEEKIKKMIKKTELEILEFAVHEIKEKLSIESNHTGMYTLLALKSSK